MPDKPKGDLSVTALYTSHTWTWAGLSCAELFATPEARAVFRVTNAALFLARLFRWSLPSLRHSLLHRHTMIDRLLRESGAHRVLELASGLSRRGAAVSADTSIEYVEVDLPHVVARKRALLERTEEGRAVLARPNLRFVAADVTEAPFGDLAPRGGSLFVIAEGLFMYLQPEAQRALWRKVHDGIAARGGTFVFDLVPTCEQPRPGIVGRTLEALMKRFTGGRSFERDARTRADIRQELLAAGFDETEAVEPRAVARAWSLPLPDARTQQLLFVCRARAGGPSS